ncbi:WxL domain-containing protein [Vagococcus sp. BWB3-3]|uniref:WxL domain-containing protein n=1 Tax=Vagococcus allomyrinae TaxID=2794353 RepID=A0A940P6D1_9ENTE|nr:WxL domain-containing protein [Vagococcus allomyrinae]MBP1042454.1 WxL domain-containing protein [Vagococcus allomyrinae]
MKNKLFLTLATIATVGAVSATTALAAENSASKTSTDVGIGFKSDKDNEPTEGPFKDNLALVFRPTEFQFGQSNKAGTASTFNNTRTGRQYIVVNDDRKGADKGQAWVVKAELSELTSGAETLANATLTFGNGAPKLFDYVLGTTPHPSKDDYIPADVNDQDNGDQATSLKPIAAGDTTYTAVSGSLTAGGKTQVAILSKDATDATKVGGIAYQMENVKLEVVDTSNLGGKSFEGTMTWTLEKNP